MHMSYSPGLVALSVIVAIIASYTALDLAGRVRAAVGRARVYWILGGAAAMGTGIWSMHFVGMLSVRMPMPVEYGAPLVLLSVAVAVFASAFALWTVSRPRVRQWRLGTAAVAMGGAIAGMHYIGMAAMEVDAQLQYDRTLWWVSIAIAVGASYVALNLARQLSFGESHRIRGYRGASAVVMGFAIAGMHYTGMAAARLTPTGQAMVVPVGGLAPAMLAAAVAIGGLLIAGLALTAGMLDRVLQARTVEAELRAAKQAAEDTSRSKSEFLSTMSHELRTPLNSVIGFANILLKNKAGNLAAQDLAYLRRIAANGEHLLELINDILDLSKIEAGRLELEIVPVDIGALVKATALGMEGQALAKGLEIVAEVPDDMVPIDADSTKLKQMLLNLISNALKFTKHGTVTVCVTADERTQRPVRIDVVDSGVGIPASRLDAIFEAFQQADSSISREFGGTGLGLAITRSMARLMGFDVQVASELGVGSTFRIHLDGGPGALRPATAHTPRISVTQRRDGRRVLVIDDDPDARLLLQQLLEDAGCEVEMAGSGAEGLRVARAQLPDLITLDLIMPRLNGYEVLETLRADPLLSSIPVVVVSIVATEQSGRALGAVALLDKPVRRDQLEATLRRYLAEPPADTHAQLNDLLDRALPVPELASLHFTPELVR
jgi:signal transduction histidine kinase/CheY-like chemotaxis protein